MNAAIEAAAGRLSVFVPNYNHGRFLADALDALLSQSVLPRQICVFDDASEDESARIIADYARRYSLIRPVFLKENRGVIHNMAEWLATQTSEFVYFAAADDKVMPTLLERSLELLVAYPEAGLCSGFSRILSAEGMDLGRFPTACPLSKAGYISPARAAAQILSDDTWLMGNTTVYRRLALVEAGGFDASLGSFCDGFVSRVIALQRGACFIPNDIAYWRRLETGFAAQTIGRAEVVRAVAERVTDLIQDHHAALFPPGYDRRWRGRWLFGAASVGLSSGRAYRQRAENLCALMRPQSRIARFGLRILAALPPPLAKPALFWSLRRADTGTMVRRRLRHLWASRFLSKRAHRAY